MYIHPMLMETALQQPGPPLFTLPCACQDLRRLARMITRIYEAELRKAGLEVAQFGLLTALGSLGEANQKRLGEGFALDSTTLTRTLGLLRRRRWVQVRRGRDKRERFFRLSPSGRQQLRHGQPHWKRAQEALRHQIGDSNWKGMTATVSALTAAVAGL